MGERGTNDTEARAHPTGQDYKLQGLATYEGLATYLDGKMKRYSLLFAVNGGAFAIAKLLGEGEVVVGGLTLKAVAIGAIIFTVLMWFDIFAFGQMMRSDDFALQEFVFKLQGKVILTALSLLLILGWLLAAFPGMPFPVVALLVLVILIVQGLYWRRPSWAGRLVKGVKSRLGASAKQPA